MYTKYSYNLSDICLVSLYVDTYKSRKLVRRERMAVVEYMHGKGPKLARKIIRLLNNSMKGK